MTQMVQGFSVLSPQGCRGKAGGGVIGPSLEVNWVQVGVVNKARLSPDLCGVFLQTNAGTQQCVYVCVVSGGWHPCLGKLGLSPG